MSYEDRILLKLKRQYSKDETVGLLTEKLRKVEIELGKYKAYAHGLEDELSSAQTRLKAIHRVSKELRQIIKSYQRKIYR